MKTKIENAIKMFLVNNNYQIEVDGNKETFSQNAKISYISSITSSQYECNETNTAFEWEKEYKQWSVVGGDIKFEGNIVFEIDKMKLTTTFFRFRFSPNPNIKIVIDDLVCQK